MSTLTEEMGIGRASIYATYGDKRALYLASLASYADATVDYVVQRIGEAERPIEEIRAFLHEVAEKAISEEGRHGCFLVNSAAELGSTDEEVRTFLAGCFSRIEDAYARALERAQTMGELDRDKDPRALARFLVAQMQCLRIVGKARPDADLIGDVVETALGCLER